jgi:hypothetical protein
MSILKVRSNWSSVLQNKKHVQFSA